ncbi:MAG: hypothetical protein FJX77_10720, partial [Armatimonadetes bacterium]|nr:hypothetical protein [Armatimonadota bacterium]
MRMDPEPNLEASRFDRRELMQTAGASATGALLLTESVAAQDNPAAQVADRASSLKITAMRTWLISPAVYLQIQTNHGVSGWGEIKGVDPRVAKTLAESLYELLDGENPTRIEYLWQKLYRAHRDIRGGPFLVHTLAGIDIALWDLAGKLWGAPVYRLLGGPCRDRIRVYHTARAKKVPPGGIFDHSCTPAEIQRIVDSIQRARDEVGLNGTVMFDAHCALPPAALIQLAA